MSHQGRTLNSTLLTPCGPHPADLVLLNIASQVSSAEDSPGLGRLWEKLDLCGSWGKG